MSETDRETEREAGLDMCIIMWLSVHRNVCVCVGGVRERERGGREGDRDRDRDRDRERAALMRASPQNQHAIIQSLVLTICPVGPLIV